MRFEVKTTYYNEEQLSQLITAQGRFGKRTVYYVMGLVLLGLCLLVMWPQFQTGNAQAAVLSLAGLAAIYGFYLFRLGRCRPTDRSTRRAAKKAIKKMNGRQEQVTFTFREGFFVVLGDRGAEQVAYGDLLRAAESAYCFMLQIQRGFFIVPKEDFNTGTPAEFPAFLREKTGMAVVQLDY